MHQRASDESASSWPCSFSSCSGRTHLCLSLGLPFFFLVSRWLFLHNDEEAQLGLIGMVSAFDTLTKLLEIIGKVLSRSSLILLDSQKMVVQCCYILFHSGGGTKGKCIIGQGDYTQKRTKTTRPKQRGDMLPSEVVISDLILDGVISSRGRLRKVYKMRLL